MIRKCLASEDEEICSIINDGASAYKGVIPADRWHEPYMALEELRVQKSEGVEFYGLESDGRLSGVMGFQDKGQVALIRHAYVRTSMRRRGVGGALLKHLASLADKPVLIGTWKAAFWAIDFYRKNGYRALGRSETEKLLRRFWRIPERQVETSIVLADAKWPDDGGSDSRR